MRLFGFTIEMVLITFKVEPPPPLPREFLNSKEFFYPSPPQKIAKNFRGHVI